MWGPEAECLTSSPSWLQTGGGGCPGWSEPCLGGTFSPTLSLAPKPHMQPQDHADSWAWVTQPRGHTWTDSHGPEPGGEGSLRPGSDQLSAQCPGAGGGRASGRASRELPSGSTGLPRRRRCLEGSQQPQQVGGPGRVGPGRSAHWEGPSAKTVQVRLHPGTTRPTSPGQSLDSLRKSPIVGTAGGRAGLNGPRGLERPS